MNSSSTDGVPFWERKTQRSSWPEHKAWRNMISRCSNPNIPEYPRYGGRGIRVCQQWRKSFAEFALTVGPRLSPCHSIDRIDNDGHYEPGNVRWATAVEQARNKSKRPLRTEIDFELPGKPLLDIRVDDVWKSFYSERRAKVVRVGIRLVVVSEGGRESTRNIHAFMIRRRLIERDGKPVQP